ncbi:hypothetical protein TNCV_3252841 [Trichonephila clavipes]|nr:hypothetical protein TNCV_3252841 [Trichonephila clavipes]
MSARHHLSDYDRGRLEAGQSVTTAAAALDVSKSVISRLKKERKYFEKACQWAWSKHHTSRGSLCSPCSKKEQKFHSWSDSCKPCNHYRYTCFSKNNLRAFKSSWFVCTEACSLHLTLITPSSREMV